jgi:hypothetical protein
MAESPDETAALERLEPFVGEWSVNAIFPAESGVGDIDEARSRFEWMLGGSFLVQHNEAPDPIPEGFCVVGVDAANGSYTQHYFDARGVARVYAMTFDGRTWTLTRTAPDFMPLEFSQRFTATFDDDGTTIRGAWQIRHGRGDWEHDFELTYTKVA